MTKWGFQGKHAHIYFIFVWRYSVKLGQKFAVFTCSGGWKLETNGGFIEIGGFGVTPRTREYRKFSPKFRWILSYKNKINMSVFPLKPSFSHFSISFLLWIPSSSLPHQESTDTLPTSPYPLVLWQLVHVFWKYWLPLPLVLWQFSTWTLLEKMFLVVYITCFQKKWCSFPYFLSR